ncbi:17-beta-hydroxysteroid dehydrogenase type 6-like isoform X1 [Anolis sagrei]|uniref:17-beta-hydroxysteroid dehydrogenase type 6-like isoform X1 n=1 Tax=Anolis sagrei TaxID=38937 RepID=UPI003521EC3A
MWLYLAALLGFYFLCRWFRERQTVEKLTEKYVFITGCDSGFGYHLARQLDAQGMRVLAGCLTQKGADQLEKVTSERLKTTLLDVTSTESVAAATEWVKGCVGNKGLWGLVNNAGIAVPQAPNEWLTKEDFMKVININLFGVIDVTVHALPLLRKARGRIVNMSSVAGRLSYFGGGYCLSKYGVEAFSDCLRRELRPFGVQVSIIEPGGFATPIQNNIVEAFQTAWSQVPSDTKDAYGQQYMETLYIVLIQGILRCANNNNWLVTDSIEHALTSRYPRTRYSIGRDAKYFHLPMSYLPTAVSDFVLARFMPKPALAL